MRAAGYLDFTTARRADCLAASDSLIEAMRKHGQLTEPPTFESLRDNADGWADVMVQAGIRHMRRGITGCMYLGCFKTFIMAMEDALQSLPVLCPPVQEACGLKGIAAARTLLQIYGHAFELIWLDVCLRTLRGEREHDQAETFRLLTLEKCRFENVLNTTSDGVLVMDGSCRITTTNRSLRQYAGEDITGKYIWDVMELEVNTPQAFFQAYPAGHIVEISPFGANLFFRLSVSALSEVSLASTGEYLVMLTNITPQVLQRKILKEAVDKKTAALREEKQRLEEMNITLRNVLDNVHSERDRRSEELCTHIRQFLLPALGRLGSESDTAARQTTIEIIRQQLDRILGDDPARDTGNTVENGLRKLTLTELKVCRLIQSGHRSKEIAQLLHISPETVQTHRKNIRRKLGIQGRDAQLAMYLMAGEAHN